MINTKQGAWLLSALSIIILILVCILIFVPSNKNADVKVSSVAPNQQVESPLLVEGQARGTWFFEASFPIRIIDESGKVLGTSYVQAQSDWMTEEFVPFKGQITFSTPVATKGFLVLAKDNPSGLPQYDKEMRIPITLKPSGMSKVKAYFMNNKMDPEITCTKVFPVEREIPKIEAIGSAALWELLKGPTQDESSGGFSTAINSGAKLLSLEIDKDGIATADFDEQLQYQVGGSCRVSAIRAQITETLMQFPTVKKVIISIDGKTEDILQP